MINPLRSEEDAFRFTVVVAVLVAPIALAAILFGSGVGLAVAGGLAFGIAFALLVLRHESAPERASVRRRPGDGRKRILVVANETLSGAALRDEIAHRAEHEEAEVFVVTHRRRGSHPSAGGRPARVRRGRGDRLDAPARPL
jgi:hypothetical protein